MVSVVGKASHIELMPSTAASKIVQPPVGNGSLRSMDGDATTTEREGGYRAKRYAVKYQPPCIFLEYEDLSKKRRVRAVKLNEIQANVDVDRLTRKVIRSFPRKLEPTSVKYDQVRKLVVKLVEYLAAGNGTTAPAAGQPARNGTPPLPSRLGAGGASHDGSGSGLGRLSDSNGIDSANGSFSSPLPAMSPRIDPRGRLGLGAAQRGSVDSTMSRFSTSTAGSSRSNSSSEDGVEGSGLASALDELEKEMEGTLGSTSGLSTLVNCSGGSSELGSRDSSFSFRDRPTVTPTPSLVGPGPGIVVTAAAASAKSRFAAEAEKLVIGLEVTEDLDLNRVTELELRMAKLAMEEDFRKNQLRPGDPGYVYDKQEEFGAPTLDNDWDESGDEEEALEEPEVDWADIHASISKPGSAATVTTVQVHAGVSSGDDSMSMGRGKNGHSPYNSNDWP